MLATPYQEFIHLTRYSRWRDELNRRERWPETVERWFQFWVWHLMVKFSWTRGDAESFVKPLADAIQRLDVMPSMRSLMTAGQALEKDNMAAFNCSYVAEDDLMVFAEIMYILMCGGGNGYSVERQFVNQLPAIPESMHETETIIFVKDSRVGWAAAFRQLLAMLYAGQIPKWDVSKVRPKGARLKTFGGRASGPEPLVNLFKFAVSLFKTASERGRKEGTTARLTSVECHDLTCKIADVVVSGGVRRSALISLSNLSDDRMRNAKNGEWWKLHKYREMANNSAAYTERPDFEVFLKEMVTLFESKSGERGIFSRVAALRKAQESMRRRTVLQKGDYEWDRYGKTDQPGYFSYGTNPCGEIILRSAGLCNLSEVVLRSTDTLEDIRHKVKLATIIGTLQSTLTNFRFVRSVWQKNAEEERLLGVSLTGIMDHPFMCKVHPETRGFLESLRTLAIQTNAEIADLLGIQHSAAITTVKPSGTVSQLVNSASGIHPRWAPYYIRRVENDDKDPVTQFLIEAGVPHEPKNGKEGISTVFEFPVQAPPGVPTRKQISAMDQLELYAMYRTHWCEHNPSTTIYYKDDDFLSVAQWVWSNFDSIGGISFLPGDDHVYPQAPYEDLTQEQYEKRLSAMPNIDWSNLAHFEKEDGTNPMGERSCVGGSCEL